MTSIQPTRPGPVDRLLTIQQAAAYLNVPARTLGEKARLREVPFTRIFKHIRFTPAGHRGDHRQGPRGHHGPVGQPPASVVRSWRSLTPLRPPWPWGLLPSPALARSRPSAGIPGDGVTGAFLAPSRPSDRPGSPAPPLRRARPQATWPATPTSPAGGRSTRSLSAHPSAWHRPRASHGRANRRSLAGRS